MAQYSPLSGENIYDVAAKLYKNTATGLGELLSLNPGINVGGDLFGTVIIYTDNQTKNPVLKTTLVDRNESYFLTRDMQTAYDLAINLYGDLSKIGILLELFPNLNSSIGLNSIVPVDLQTDPIAKYFKDRNLIVATEISYMGISGNRVLREDGSFALREDGSYILTES